MTGPAIQDRYEVRGLLGEGGAGVVHRVFDRVRGREIALKSLRNTEGRDLYRFKREFRGLADLAHPNLVALHELQTVGGDWMFTMELVEGVPFDQWVRPGGALDEARLRDALAQLADGLTALHASGKLHRDVKPSNVLVEPGGRVVLLDFGLLADAVDGERTHERAAVGTPAFMSPEQAADAPLGPPSDWYSVGATLYLALTGRYTFDGPTGLVLAQKLDEDPPPPRAIAPGVPADLDALCVRLLDRDPARRPDGREVLAALGRAPSPATERIARHAEFGPFVGRGRELAALRAALAARDGGSGVVVIVGASGMGKTALLRAFLDELVAEPDAVVLEGRCYEREAVPFKTIDGVIDDLAARLCVSGHRTSVAPRDAAALLRLFPVMRRVPWLDVPVLPGQLPADPTELRRRALIALRRLLADLAPGGPLVIAIDDLQWGDVDGAAVLAEALAPGDGDPRALVVATHRGEDADDGAALATLRHALGDAVRTIELEALLEVDARRLWAQLTSGADDRGAIRDADGSPMLLCELARARVDGAEEVATVDDAVRARIDRLAADARAVIEVVSVAGRPLRLADVAHAAGLADVGDAVAALRGEQLVRVRGAEPVVEARHDRIRSAVDAGLADDRRRDVHARLADQLDGDASGEAERLVQHWLGAGDADRAAAVAERAAARAEERLAFHRAAELLGLALLRGDLDEAARRDLLARRGRALGAAGQLVEAAAELRAASGLARGRDRLTLDRLAVEMLLKAGQLDRGRAAARALLAEVGETLPARPTVAAVVERARLRVRGLGYTERPASAVPRAVLDRLDALMSVASGMSFVEPATGVALHTRALRRALDAGEPRRLTIALTHELAFLGIGGADAAHRIDDLRARTLAVARRSGEPGAVGFAEAGAGIGAYLSGRFRDGLTRIDAGLAHMTGASGDLRWQLDLVRILRLAALLWLGELRELHTWQAEQLRAALAEGNVNAERHVSSWPGSLRWLVDGEAAEARRRIDGATPRRAPGESFHLHHYHATAGRAFTELYEGDATAAHRRIEDRWRMFERAHVLRIQIVAIEAWYLRGCAAVAARPARLDHARRCAERLERFGVGHASALAAALRAQLAAARGDLAAAAQARRSSAWLADAAGMRLHAAIARLRLGELIGGDEGHGLVAATRTWLRDEGVADPPAIARMVSPV